MDQNIAPIDMNIKRTISNGKIYEMVDLETYGAHPDQYVGRLDVGIEIHDDEHDEDLVLPLRDSYHGTPITPGVYNAGAVDFTVMPDEANYQKYIPEKTVTLSNKMDAKQIIESGEILVKLDEPFITTPDNITTVPIMSVDEPEMRAIKLAINDKHIDFDKYANRFGPNFPNDKRQLKNNQITLNIVKRFCNNLDIEAVLVLRNKNDNVPNPLSEDIVVSLTDGFSEDN